MQCLNVLYIIGLIILWSFKSLININVCLLNMFLFKQGLNTRKSTKTFSRICYTVSAEWWHLDKKLDVGGVN